MAAVAAVLLAGRGESSGGSAQPEPTSGREEAASPAPDGAQATEAAAPSSAGHAPVWLISGEVAGGEASLLDPLYVVERPPADLPERGEHRIEARDERGEALAAQPFQPELDVDGTGGEGTGGDQAGSFATLLAYEPDAVELAVVGPEEATLTSVSLEGGPPTVEVTSPAAGDVVDDLVAATWEASDDTVAVLLEHSSDGGATWDVLAAGWTDEAYTLDPDRLPASAEDGSSLLRVTASNGSSSATATSSGFTVVGGEGEAPAVWITSPPDDHAYRSTGGHLVLDADGHHADLDVLDGEALVWESDLDGHLGTGRLVEGLASLSEGTHTITVTTTDSQGRSASDSVTVTIDPHEPALAVTVDGREEIDEDASLEGPVTITIDADAVGGSPLATVGYSLDGGETHAEVDLRALPYAVTVEEGDVHLVVYATDVADNQAVESRRFTVAAEG